MTFVTSMNYKVTYSGKFSTTFVKQTTYPAFISRINSHNFKRLTERLWSIPVAAHLSEIDNLFEYVDALMIIRQAEYPDAPYTKNVHELLQMRSSLNMLELLDIQLQGLFIKYNSDVTRQVLNHPDSASPVYMFWPIIILCADWEETKLLLRYMPLPIADRWMREDFPSMRSASRSDYLEQISKRGDRWGHVSFNMLATLYL